MKLSFRWYGSDDPVTLSQIRQIPGMKGIVTSLYHVPVGSVWQVEDIMAIKRDVQHHGLEITVIESVPVHEDIKMGKPTRDAYVRNYTETIRNLAKAGIHTVCYNFMPMFDWLRTELAQVLPDGSNTLSYEDRQVDEAALLAGRLKLPAWNLDGDQRTLLDMLEAYRAMSDETLWSNLTYFVEAVMPVAKECGVKMTIHPDDPPWPVLGIPRIMTTRDNFERFLGLYEDACHGICFCTGSLGASPDNDLPAMVRQFGGGGRIHFVHLRNIRRMGPRSFYESGHLSAEGSIDMYEVMSALHEVGFSGPVRPDHGRMVFGESGNPGYGLYDRAMGATYLNGLWEAITKR